LVDFLALFTERHDSLMKRSNGTWLALSRYHRLTDEEIVQALELKSTTQRATQFGALTRIAAIQFCSPNAEANIERLRTFNYALGDSMRNAKAFLVNGDVFVYLFLKTTAPSKELSAVLRTLLEAIGISADEFTKVHPEHGAVPIPLQPGFSWLNFDGAIIVRREEITLESALAMFMSELGKIALDAEAFFQAITKIVEKHSIAATVTLSNRDELTEQSGIVHSDDSEETIPIYPVKETETSGVLASDLELADETPQRVNDFILSLDVATESSVPSKSEWEDEAVLQLRIPIPRLDMEGGDSDFSGNNRIARSPPQKLRKRVKRKCRSPDNGNNPIDIL